jgi:serine/threonine protein kinase
MRGDSLSQNSHAEVIQATHPTPPLIQLGQTKLSEYTKLSVLGKGTYGEVHKCVHTPTGLIVAMKTYMFEVRRLMLTCLERNQWNKLFDYARNQLASLVSKLRTVCETARYFGGRSGQHQKHPLHL